MHTFDSRPQRTIMAVYGRSRRRRAKVAYAKEDDDEDCDKEDAVRDFDDDDKASTANNNAGETIDVPASTHSRDATDSIKQIPKRNRKLQSKKVLADVQVRAHGTASETLTKAAKDEDSEASLVVLKTKAKRTSKPPAVLAESSTSSSSDVEERSCTATRGLALTESSQPPATVDDDDVDDAAVEALITPLAKTSLTEEQVKRAYQRPLSVVDSSLMSQGPSCLLETCNQYEPVGFSSLLDILQDTYKAAAWRKAGEASYSEVFSLEGAKRVIKVIPLRRIDEPSIEEAGDNSTSSTSSCAPLPERSYPRNVRREVNVTRTLSRTNGTFVKLHAAYVARGPYPQRLLRAWDRRQRKKTAINIRPDVFPDDQLYSVLVLSHAGRDLESADLTSWKQAAGLFCQVVKALADAEKSCHFEHRDLHWGNVVVRKIAADKLVKTPPGKRVTMTELTAPKWAGLSTTIIDFTLARAEVDDAVTAHPFDDDAYFIGQGDAQFEVYRQMRAVTKGRWKEHHPRTNALWLNYLATKLLEEKASKLPIISSNVSDDEGAADCKAIKIASDALSDSREERICHALLQRMQFLLSQDVSLPETRARFASAGHVLRNLATIVRGLT